MKIIDWIAILGALAWTPHLISLIKYYFTKPEVRIITGKDAEIGFTTLGPIFNMHIAFTAKNRDIMISNFNIKVTHDSGEEKNYEWQNLRQKVMEAHTNDGAIPYEKQSSVLAVKLNQREIEERRIQCREISFGEGLRHIYYKVEKRLAYDKDQEGFDPLRFCKCEEFTEVYNFTKQAFTWKPGKYKVVFELESPDHFNIVDNEYEFTLTPMDIEMLETNKNSIEQDYINRLLGSKNEEYKEVFWSWRYRPLYKINSK